MPRPKRLSGFRREVEIVSTASGLASGSPSVDDLTYYLSDLERNAEIVKIKRPLAVIANAPLPDEARARISVDMPFPHVALGFVNGAIAASSDPYHATYMHFDGEGRLLDDVGECENLKNTPAYKTRTVDANGVARVTVKFEHHLHVTGPAMPLAFTPTMHHFHSHFLLQCFPRILILRDLGIEASILVAGDLRRKQREMLNLVGIPDERIIPIPDNSIVSADYLVVPQPWPLAFSPYTLRIYSELSGLFAGGAVDRRRRVLISREQRTSWRNLHTYRAIQDRLVSQYGFEVVRPELLTLAEEIEIYRTAVIVIGAEGAGLYSAVYAGPGQTYLAIGDQDYIMPVLGSAASAKGFDVGYVFGESYRADTDVDRRVPAGHSDFAVDPDSVAALVERVLG